MERLLRAGPLSNVTQAKARVGLLNVFTPLVPALEDQRHGLTVLLEQWGGKSTYWVWTDEGDEVSAALARLTQLSTPTFVKVAIIADDLNDYGYVWRVLSRPPSMEPAVPRLLDRSRRATVSCPRPHHSGLSGVAGLASPVPLTG